MTKSKIIFYFFFTIISVAGVVVQTNQWQSTSITSNTGNQRFDDVFFLNENLGWAANGFNATVYKTTDGGLNWVKQFDEDDLGIDIYLRNIVFLDENIGFLGTLSTKMYKTLNGGTNWTEVTNISPFPAAICGLDTAGSSTIYGCGAYFEPAYLIKSTDAGVNWTYKDMSAYATALVEVKFVSELIGYASGKNATGAIVIKTIDGGQTWTEIYNSGILGESVWKLQILNTDSNIIFGAIETASLMDGKLLKSNDAGVNWTSLDAPDVEVQAVGFISETHGWMGGYKEGIYETTDAGNTWLKLGIGGNLNRIFVINENSVYAAGTSVYKYTDQSLGVQDHLIAKRKPLAINILQNPVANFLKFSIAFKSEDHIVIELYDANGKFMKKLFRDNVTSGIKEYQYNLKDIASGIYILNFHNNTGRQSVKFVKI